MSHTAEIHVPENSPRRVGVVESDARDKTRKVVVAFVARHPKYGKFTKRRTVLHVHDEKNASRTPWRLSSASQRSHCAGQQSYAQGMIRKRKPSGKMSRSLAHDMGVMAWVRAHGTGRCGSSRLRSVAEDGLAGQLGTHTSRRPASPAWR